MSATPATWCSASIAHGQAYHKTSKQSVNGESDCMHAWRQKNITLNICQTKTCFFRVNTLRNRLFSKPPTVYRRKHVVSRPFHRSYLKANKISKSERIKKLNMRIIFESVLMLCTKYCGLSARSHQLHFRRNKENRKTKFTSRLKISQMAYWNGKTLLVLTIHLRMRLITEVCVWEIGILYISY